MLKRHAGILVTLAIISGAVLILVLNLEPAGTRLPPPPPLENATPLTTGLPAGAVGFREYPIGDEVEQSGLRIAAVGCPPFTWRGWSLIQGWTRFTLRRTFTPWKRTSTDSARMSSCLISRLATRSFRAKGAPHWKGTWSQWLRVTVSITERISSCPGQADIGSSTGSIRRRRSLAGTMIRLPGSPVVGTVRGLLRLELRRASSQGDQERRRLIP